MTPWPEILALSLEALPQEPFSLQILGFLDPHTAPNKHRQLIKEQTILHTTMDIPTMLEKTHDILFTNILNYLSSINLKNKGKST